MLYKINIDFNNINESSKILFSIPIHEKHDIINNQIENILNYNPNSKIILHVNNSFKDFDSDLINYNNVFINPKKYNYKYAKGLLYIHVKNFLYCIEENINFDYFVILSSNELFIKNGLIHYIEKYENGCQIIEFSKDIKWHNFQKNIEKNEFMIKLLLYLNIDTFYGGQTEGQFYKKDIFNKISEIYLNIFGENELHDFETEEIVIQTIFKSFKLNYNLPFTLQNYSNNLIFTEKFIDNIRNNKIIIDDNTISNNLKSPHINQNCDSIFSLKRIDRTFNNLRYYLTKKGFILNEDDYQLHTYYFSNGSKIMFYKEDYFIFKKQKKSEYHWFGYNVKKGKYILKFKIKLLKQINNIENIGIKIHHPYEILYNYFFEDIKLNSWVEVILPIDIKKNDLLLFIFDNYNDEIIIEIKDIELSNLKNINNKSNIGIFLYEYENNKNDYQINYNNINKMIIKPFSKFYNIYTFLNLYEKNNYLINAYQPCFINYYKETINNIFLKNTTDIINIDLDFKFIIYLKLDSIFNKNIIDFNFFINKFNFISYHIPYINDKICNSYDFMSIPLNFINDFREILKKNLNDDNICYLLYENLKNNNNDFNFIFDENYFNNTRTPLIKFIKDLNKKDIKINEGFDLNRKYIKQIFYNSNNFLLLNNENDEFYIKCKNKIKNTPFHWFGYYLNIFEKKNSNDFISIKVSFEIKLLKKIEVKKDDFGLKIHHPFTYYNDWIQFCELNIYKKIEIDVKILQINQYIILNFDNYLNDIEFLIKNFKILNLFN